MHLKLIYSNGVKLAETDEQLSECVSCDELADLDESGVCENCTEYESDEVPF